MLPAKRKSAGQKDLKKFISLYGEEVAKGYLLAFHDLLPRLINIFEGVSHATMKNQGYDLCTQMESLLELQTKSDFDAKSESGTIQEPPSPQ